MKFIDDANKQIKWNNKNYFFAATIFIIVLNIVIFAIFGNSWNFGFHNPDAKWTEFSLRNIVSIPFTAFSHSNWIHVLSNMGFFAVIGFYLERKYGTFFLFSTVVLFSFIAPAMTSHVYLSIFHHGFSGVNYACYSFIIVDIIFSFFKEKKNKFNFVISICMLIFIYISISFKTTGGIVFKGYPYDLIHNMGHYCGFLLGILFGVFYQLFCRNNYNFKKKKVKYNEKQE